MRTLTRAWWGRRIRIPVLACAVLAAALPEAGAAVQRDAVRVEQLPAGEASVAWGVARERHPRAGLAGWYYAPGWGLPHGCIPPTGTFYTFVRQCPENGAISLDWAIVAWEKGELKYSERSGPDPLPAEALQQPRLSVNQAWARIAAELADCGCTVPKQRPWRSAPRLRLVEDGKRIRLVYEFSPRYSHYVVCADAVSGEVGGLRMTYFGAGGLYPEPLYPVREPQAGHDVERLRGWVAGREPRKPTRRPGSPARGNG